MDRKEDYTKYLASEMNLSASRVAATLALLSEGATVPFISRYRKEVTGSMDEVQITALRDRQKQLKELDDRRSTILDTISGQGSLSPELRSKIMAAGTLTALEDLYLPYRPKRRTRATIAREKGLEPLAKMIMRQDDHHPEDTARRFVNPQKEVADTETALAGARDIISEWVNEDQRSRTRIRRLFERRATLKTTLVKGKEAEGAKFRDYFDWEERLDRAPSHRVLAMRRAEKEKIIRLRIAPNEEEALEQLERLFVRGNNAAGDQVKLAVRDGYKRLLSSAIETEMRVISKKKADEEAIKVFADNLRQLLLAPALGGKRTLALDPGFRSGCKVVCLDEQGKLLHHDVIFPHPPQSRSVPASIKIKKLVDRYKIEAIAIGNGTAGRETDAFIREMGFQQLSIEMVNESGASIYSASEVAREEFPDHDLTVRGAVSIGRRLMDPLAELVKLDPKSIGVGQYQHDVDQNALKGSLDDVVVSCVNGVGVEVNTASKQLLTYVSGLGPVLASNIVNYRNENGPFQSRKALKKVPRLGAKAFEQAAGFLRIRGGKHPLDSSGVHPESYPVVDQMAASLGCSVVDLMTQEDLRKQIQLKNFVSDTIGLPTLKDIMKELAKPGRDPRAQFEEFAFEDGVSKVSDLREGMELPGIVTNITKFGAFVDVGVHQDGLVHVSQMADRFIKDPAEIVKVQQKVRVRVLEVDIDRKRISLGMKGVPQK